MSLYAGIEAGGTKFICGVAKDDGQIIDKVQFPTTVPEETLDKVVEFFKKYNDIRALGIGAFGPVCLDRKSPYYGCVMKTPKIAWQHYNMLAYLQPFFPEIPIGFDTDVNVAALGEQKWGAAQGLTDILYITVGTGIGGGVIANNRMLHGLTHPEVGHIRVKKSPNEIEGFDGVCAIHQNCLEGMASGPALNTRFKVESCSHLPKDHIAWEIASDYLAQALVNYVLILSPQKIIMGGGVMKQTQLFSMIQKKLQVMLNGYVSHALLEADIDQLIVPPALGGDAGLKGAIALAMQSLKCETTTHAH
ncbi:ROK family protein [Facilibium subflavum]|uniref:ROK family protein n=1 Tax=Facilibium subflavum TaxID=2219058 RepID=UPI000E647048|nr:ROK family protein [Facilibium subflavum]